MDNYSANGSNVSDDVFGFIPPNMMFPGNSADKDHQFSSKEEMERYYYHMDHDKDLSIRNSSH